MAAKFLGEPTKVVTGSHDRTLKIWDLRSKACVETKFAGSICNDLVTWDGSGATIISGHFDQRLRFWDARTECGSNGVLLQGKVTSLDISKDGKYLLACTRDDSLKLLDLRMNQVVTTFTAENFRVVCDWARAAFSADGRHVAAGSADGSLLVWAVATGKLEHTLQEHGSNGVTAVSFHPHGSFMASVDKKRKAVIWTDL
ncbi:autophagy-related protein 16-1-like [Schistocerca piceifrons]|uniref:autophagy-related protein 16-1-like n=1 Tax=Schistocerca piceifrons TaxID=274613 RepID=UPI001F5ECC04|nr:autophagy-related protein 16-1-like [Schistocerca piceifrons]XP_049763299.1 autophagy-related protein 16-1-like [Schistocerca cancellata]